MTAERSANEIAHAAAVREMFAGIAGKYDFLNHFLSGNIDKRWRRIVADKLRDVLERPDAVVLDVACGTGDLSIEMSRNSAARIVGTDFCRPMLTVANHKVASLNKTIPLIEGDAMDLPFPDSTFHAVTIAFGLRNLSNFEAGINELNRILKPGGSLAVLEFSSPVVPGFRQIFNFYFSQILPRLGGAVSGSRGAYEYLPNSVAKFPDQRQLVLMLERSGFRSVEYKNLTGGIAALHFGVKK